MRSNGAAGGFLFNLQIINDVYMRGATKGDLDRGMGGEGVKLREDSQQGTML